MSEPLGNASLSRSVRGLTAARPRSAGGAGGRRVARVPERPAELFARGVDWLVAAALAREGRLNGYLTSVQDATLPGYAGVIAPEGGDRAADAVVEVLEDMTVLPSVTRTWYLARFGESASPGPESVARLALSSGPSYSSERALRALGLLESMGVADRAAVASRRATAGVGGACAPSAREPWRAELLWMAAESRARGMLRERALRGGGVVVPARWSWEAQATVGGPWNPAYGEAAVRRARDAILRQAVREDDARGPGGRLGVAALVFGGCG